MLLGEAGARVEERTVTPIYGDERSGLRPWLAVFTHSWVLLRALAWRLRVRRRGPRLLEAIRAQRADQALAPSAGEGADEGRRVRTP